LSSKVKDQDHWEWERKAKIVFAPILWIDLRQIRPKMITGTRTCMSSNTFHQQKYFVLWYLSVCLSVTYLSFTEYWNAVEKFIFYGKLTTYT